MTLRNLLALSAVCAGSAAFAAEGNMYGNQSQNEGFDIVPAKGPVTVDGKIDPDEWDLSGQMWSFADWDARNDFSVKTAAMYDKDFVYLCFDWRDPLPLNSLIDPRSDPSRGWMADAIQLRTLTDDMVVWFTMWGYDKGTKPAFHYVRAGDGKNPSNPKVENPSELLYTGVAGEAKLGKGVELAYRMADDGKGFTQEVKIPWGLVYADASHAAKAGDAFRMGVEFYWGTLAGTGFPMHNYKDNLQPGVYTREFFWTAQNAWGTVNLLPGSAKPRTYRPSIVKPQGPIAVRASVPKGCEFFSLAIDDKDGRHVRNLAGGFRTEDYAVSEKDGQTVVEVAWDGLDEAEKSVPAGTYRARALGSNRIDGYWEACFYCPGTPPWATRDHTGGWGADHSAVQRVSCAGDMTILCSGFAEGGDGTIALGPNGRKAWGEKRGSSVVTGNGKYVFTVPNDWGRSGVQICRMDAKTGKYLPFAKGSDMPLDLTAFLGLGKDEKPPRVMGLALCASGLLVLTDDDKLRVADPETGAILRTLPFVVDRDPNGVAVPFAAEGDLAYAFRDGALVETNLKTGDVRSQAVDVALPKGMAVRDGVLYVADGGPDMQIKKFSPQGRLLGTIGRKGGRARQGRFERDGVRDPSGLSVSAAGEVWVAENQQYPRRVSVFDLEGRFMRDYLGNAGYAGGGTLIHRQDPTKAFARLNEIVLDPVKHTWDVSRIMFNPDPSKGTVVNPSSTAFHYGDMFYSSASGERHEYFSVIGSPLTAQFHIMMRVGEDWQPVAALTTVAAVQKLLGGSYRAMVERAPSGEWADNDPADVLIWNDYNNDGYLQKAECEVVPSIMKTVTPPDAKRLKNVQSGMALMACSNTTTDMDDLGFYAARVLGPKERVNGRLVPVSYRDGGRPVYSMKGFVRTPNQELTPNGAATEVPGKDLVVGFVTLNRRTYVAGWRKSTGEILWKYISPYHQVHGSHHAPMPRPGLVIGCLKVMGVATGCGDKDVFMVRGNLGEDYFFTTDGFLVNRWTKDGRLPGMPPPEDEALLRKSSYANYCGRGEHFTGTFTRQSDGVVRASGGAPASQAGNVFRIEGLDSIRAGSTETFEISDADVIAADRMNAERTLAARKTVEPLKIGSDMKKAKPVRISSDGQKVSADFRAASDGTNLELCWTIQNDDSPWVNKGKDWRLLFKTGDCVDFQLSPTGNKARTAAKDDFRLLVAPFEKGNVAVLMKEKTSGAKAPYTYNSPVVAVKFESVTRLNAVPQVKRGNGRTIVTLTVPWSELGLAAPAAGSKLTGDVGFILSDANGTINVARVYRANKATNLVNDQPGEARIVPFGFAEVDFE